VQKGVHSESHVPRYGRELAPAINGSGCRGVPGLVPQPLCMKFKSAFYSKLFPVDYNRPIGLSRGAPSGFRCAQLIPESYAKLLDLLYSVIVKYNTAG